MLAKKLYGIQLRPYISLPVYAGDWDGMAYEFDVSGITTSGDSKFRPFMFGASALLTIGIDTK